jgi:hypothetical protein
MVMGMGDYYSRCGSFFSTRHRAAIFFSHFVVLISPLLLPTPPFTILTARVLDDLFPRPVIDRPRRMPPIVRSVQLAHLPNIFTCMRIFLLLQLVYSTTAPLDLLLIDLDEDLEEALTTIYKKRGEEYPHEGTRYGQWEPAERVSGARFNFS